MKFLLSFVLFAFFAAGIAAAEETDQSAADADNGETGRAEEEKDLFDFVIPEEVPAEDGTAPIPAEDPIPAGDPIPAAVPVTTVSVAVNTIEDLKKLHTVHDAVIRSTFIADPGQNVRFRFETELAELKAIRDFRKAHPEQVLPDAGWCGYFPFDREVSVLKRRRAMPEVKAILLKEFPAYKKICEETGIPSLQMHGMELEMLRDFLLSAGREEDLKKVFTRKIEYLIRQGLVLTPRMELGGCLADAVYALYDTATPEGRRMRNAMRTYPYEYAYEHGGLTGRQQLLCLTEIGLLDPVWLTEHAEAVRRLALDTITRRDTCNFLSILAKTLYRNKETDPDTQKALESLNGSFRIREIRTPGTKTYAACGSQGRVWLLQTHAEQQIFLTEYDVSKGECTDCNIPQSAVLAGKDSYTMNVWGDWVFIGAGRRMLLYNAKTGQWNPELISAGEHPASAVVSNDRVYYFCGGIPGRNGKDQELSMHSCLLDGSDRKTHFDEEHNGLQTRISITAGRITGPVPVSDGSFLFGIHSRNRFCCLYSFDPERDRFTTVGSFPLILDTFVLRAQGNMLLAQTGSRFFTSPCDRISPEFILTQEKADPTEASCRLEGFGSLRMPALISGDLLVSAGSANPLILNLKNPSGSPFLILPPVMDVFNFPPSKEILFPAENGKIYSVIPK